VRFLLLAMIVLGLSSFASALEEQDVCVKYQTQSGWSKGYKVEGKVMRGSELNSATRSLDYNVLSTYVVIFWNQDEVSILELNSYFGSISILGQDATDQSGKAWQVSSSSLCY
jgi:hypothetical protein